MELAEIAFKDSNDYQKFIDNIANLDRVESIERIDIKDLGKYTTTKNEHLMIERCRKENVHL